MFFEYGVNDFCDLVIELDCMVKVLWDKGLLVMYLCFFDEGYSVSKLENCVIFYCVLVEFLECYLII